MKEHEADVDVRVGVITVSTSRWRKFGDVMGVENIPEDDKSGRILAEELNCVDYRLVPDDRSKIITAILDMLNRVDVIITTGGTGISPKDVTIEAVKMVVEKEMEGFFALNLRAGIWLGWHEDGSPSFRSEYREGELHTWEQFGEDGKSRTYGKVKNRFGA